MTQTTVVEASPSGLVEKVESMTPRALMKEARKAAENISRSSYELGALLSSIKVRIHKEKKAFGYDGFTDYVRAELKVDVAQANNFIRVYHRLRDQGVDYGTVEQLPFSTLQIVSNMITAENAPVLVEQLKGKSVKEVKSLVAGQVPKDPAKVQAAQKSVAAKKAKKAQTSAPVAGDDALTVEHSFIPKGSAPAAVDPVDAYAKSLTVEQLTALLKAIPKAVLIDALNASKVLGIKLTTAKGSAKAVKAQQPEQPAA